MGNNKLLWGVGGGRLLETLACHPERGINPFNPDSAKSKIQ